LDCLAAAGELSQPIMNPYSELIKLRQYHCQDAIKTNSAVAIGGIEQACAVTAGTLKIAEEAG